MPPPEHSLRALIDAASLLVDTLFDPSGQMRAYFLATGPNKNATLAVAEFTDVRTELAFRLGLPTMLRRDGFTSWCFFTEAWAAICERGDTRTLPQAAPNRVEVVIFAAENLAGEKLMASRQIVRGNGPARLLPLVITTERSCFVTAPIDAPTEQQRSDADDAHA